MHAKHLCALLLVPALVFGASLSHGKSRQQRPLAPNPSAFVAADIGFSRLSQDKGAFAAVREFAEDQAQILNLTPHSVPALARDWGKAVPAAFRLQPQGVMVSCDGNIGVTQGRWTSGHQSGHYVSLWTRDDKGRLKWRIHQRSAPGLGPSDADAPEFITTRQASCQPKGAQPSAAAVGLTVEAEGQSRDGSLSWNIIPMADGSRALSVRIWDGKIMDMVIAPTTELAHL